MVYVEGGYYTMGDVFCSDNYNPLYEAKVNSFYMGKYEVTHGEYIEFLNSRGVSSDGLYNGNELIAMSVCAIAHDGSFFYFDDSSKASDKQCPVIYVTWYGACEYCNWLSKQEGYDKAYTINEDSVEINWDANGYRLPTEAEWEYAARSKGREDRKWSGTNSVSELAEYCWFGEGFSTGVHPVGTKQPNDIGLYDMSGNVYEWCWDWYSDSYYSNYILNNIPTGPSSGSERVLRGGGYDSRAHDCRTSYRFQYNPKLSYIHFGFRILRSEYGMRLVF